jgi:Spy/CpxP family protein refolding chaperone
VLKGGRSGRGWHPHGPHSHGPHHRGPWGRWGPPPPPPFGGPPWARGRRRLQWLYRELETTPEQERTIKDAVEEVLDARHALLRERRKSGEDFAESIAGDSFDENVLGETFSRQDDRVRDLQKALAGALGRVHAVLDPDQRRRLARILARGPGRGPGFGPFRDGPPPPPPGEGPPPPPPFDDEVL